MPIPINRTLVVGLGKTGRTIVHRLRRRLQEQYGGVPYVSFLTIYPEGEPKGEAPWTEAEEIELSTWALDEFIAKNPEVRSRLPKEYNFASDNLLGTRLGANLAFQRLVKEGREGKIARTLETTLQRLFGPRDRFWQGTSLEFEVTRPKTDQAGREVPVREVTVYIIAALNDPIGSGILPDFAYALQQHRFFVEQTYDCSSVGLLLSFDELPEALANSYAALKEVDAAMSQATYRNEFLGINASYRPFNRACYFVELSNEADYPKDRELHKSSYGEVMVAEWLRWMITHLVEVEVEMGNIESRLVRLGFDPANMDSQKIPAYSSFGFAAGLVPVKELLDYFAYRLGGQFASEQCLLAAPPQDAEKPLVETFWKERAQMDARAVVDVMTEEEKAQYRKRFEEEPVEDYSRPMQGRIALPIDEQLADSALFSIKDPLPPEPGPSQEQEEKMRRFPILGNLVLAAVRLYNLLRKDAAGLHGLRQQIRFKRELQEHAESEHQKRLDRKLTEEVIPSGTKVVSDESWKVVSNEPVGGVGLAIAFCHALSHKLSNARLETEAVYSKLHGWARQGIYTERWSMPFILLVAVGFLPMIIPIKPPIPLPISILLKVFIAILGLVVIISLISMFLALLSWAPPFLDALVLGKDLWDPVLKISIGGTILLTVLSHLYNLLANLTQRDPADRPVLSNSYLQYCMFYLALYTTGALLGLYIAGEATLVALLIGATIFISSVLTALEYIWMHRRYQQFQSRGTYIPSVGDMLLGITLTMAHTGILGFAATFFLSAVGLAALPLLLGGILLVMLILGAVKYIFDFLFARYRLREGALSYYGSMDFIRRFIAFFVVVIVAVLLIALEPLQDLLYGAIASQFRGLALAVLGIGIVLMLAIYLLPRLQLYEFAFIFPPAPTPARNYREAERSGDNALKNIPSLGLTLWRVVVMSLLTLAVIVWMKSGGDPLQLWSALLVWMKSGGDPSQLWGALFTSQNAPIWLLGGIFVSRYLYDLIFAHARRENLPTTHGLLSWLAFVIVITAIVGFSVAAGLGPFGDWVDVAHRDLVLIAVLLLGGLAVLRYVWEYVNDLARIWYLAKDWVDWYEKMALQRLRIASLGTALKFYNRMLVVTGSQVQALEQFRNRLAQLDQQFAQAEDAIRDHILQTEVEYQRYVLDPQRAERIYHDQVLADIGAEAREYFRRHPLLETWRWQSFDTICEDLKAYVNERFDTYWREHGVINFLGDSEHPTFRDLERKIGWLFAKACKPYWHYYGTTHGEFFAYVSMPAGDVKDIIELQDAVIGLAGPLIGGPIRELRTGDRYSVTSITFRHGVSLHLLSSMPEYQRAYETQIETNPWLHIRNGLVDELPGLFPGNNEAQRYQERKQSRQRQAKASS